MKYLEIEKNKVKATEYCELSINLEEFTKVKEEMLSNDSTVELTEINSKNSLVITVPGFIELVFPNKMDSIKLTLPYEIQVFKNDILISNSKELKLAFHQGDTIFQAQFKSFQTNILTLGSLFENRFKYISDDIYQLTVGIYNQLKGISGAHFINIELILSQLFGTELNGRFVPLRLTGKEYSKEYALNTKQSAHNFGNSIGFSYGYSNDYLLNKMSNTTKKENSYFEDIIAGNYSKLKDK